MSNKFLHTSSVLAFIGLSLFSFSAKAMNKPDPEEENSHTRPITQRTEIETDSQQTDSIWNNFTQSVQTAARRTVVNLFYDGFSPEETAQALVESMQLDVQKNQTQQVNRPSHTVENSPQAPNEGTPQKIFKLKRDLFKDFKNRAWIFKNDCSTVGLISDDGLSIETSRTEKSYQFKFNVNTDQANELFMPLSINVKRGKLWLGFLNENESVWIPGQRQLSPGEHIFEDTIPINGQRTLTFIIADHNNIGENCEFNVRYLLINLK